MISENEVNKTIQTIHPSIHPNVLTINLVMQHIIPIPPLSPNPPFCSLGGQRFTTHHYTQTYQALKHWFQRKGRGLDSLVYWFQRKKGKGWG
mmetsp:Transcript_32102/g.54087  ORF Transcript_32102/g.54087 Transcript_32102/m.54087 type:complete len:92 (+) Transcript_32102:1112-1387(+)